MLMRILSFLILFLLPIGAMAEEPQTRELLTQELEAGGDPALIAQKKHFPRHYETVVILLLQMRNAPDVVEAAAAQRRLGEASSRHWDQYSELVAQAQPADWHALLTIRRDLFDLINRGHGPYLCYQYEFGGAQVLISADRDRYYALISDYISTFIETAARARQAPQEADPVRTTDLESLYAQMVEISGDETMLSALRPGRLLHSKFCTATVLMMSTALTLEAPVGPRVWRYLVTRPAGMQ